MSFDDEWAQHMATAKAERATQMRLNQADDGGGQGSKKKLHVTPSLLRGRAERAEHKASKEFRDAHTIAVSKTSEISGSMKGFSSDEAFTEFIDSWKKGVKYVSGQIGNEGLAKALRSSANSFGNEEEERKKSFRGEGTYKPGDVI
ncbi:hypothetical protein OG883_10205 [Streptomyces sp. NBC_01142]|uniref:hypothetical protein n=1 Tax=Streptomyces sp. NBC_01142 TaxID=2975865 RepID=UPI00224EF6E3|nr:hypothetical protein [Streptomyces sp. NBC_01142]MCX4820270.1 hypothetical protein [Streptomyces sp. NBC_01142]